VEEAVAMSDEMHEGQRLTKDEVLLWLDDHIGAVVHVGLTVATGDISHEVLSASGELRPWRDSDVAPAFQPHPTEDVVGQYRIGRDGSLDVTSIPLWLADVRPEAIEHGDASELRFPLGSFAELRVTTSRSGDA
jgi:hypothetical protein